ncbi:hypothetical protein OH77DRAFT_1525180 [Trametes cingulata]|nr:hypothetical protein OH77DRAFT_1525180 [Trametes cingulata]
MAPRQRDAPPAPGLLASAFSFVTREIESFVTAATGGEVQPKQQPHQEERQPEASSSRVTLDGTGRDRHESRTASEREKRGKRVRKRSEVESERARARRRVRREEEDGSDDERDRALRAMKKQAQPAPRSRSSDREAADDEDDEPAPPTLKKPLKKKREIVEDPGPPEDVARDVDAVKAPAPKKQPAKRADKSTDPSELMPPPPTPIRPPSSPAMPLMTPAPTMPGSLFPRSASLMPEPIPSNLKRAVPRPRTPTPPPQPTAEEAASVHEEGINESPLQSPGRRRSRENLARIPSDRSTDGPEPSSVSEITWRSEHSEQVASSSRGSLDEPAELVPKARSAKGKERACDTSGEIRVRGKERELREAREEHARNAHERDGSERERDKQRIRMLEEEVARLRAELALKSNGSMMPPPPPPPPPPPLFRPQAPTASSAAGGTDNFLASARASLKPAGPPVEAPINSAAYGGARTKKAGHPTVNVPSDKMAAFLREMKNVRLRRVGGLTGNASMAPPASTTEGNAGDLSRSNSGTGMSRARMAATLGERSFDLGVATRLEIGEKRKRDAFEDHQAGPSKRRETTFVRSENTGASSASGFQSSASGSQSSSSSSVRSSTSRTSFLEMGPPRSQPSRPRTNATLRIWPTGSTAETDLTTPSLCSDNENDHEHEDQLLDTPSDSGRNRACSKDSKSVAVRSRDLGPEHEVIDVDALETPPKVQPRTESPVEDKKDLFSSRPPASPLPASSKTPNKPKPPARAAKSKLPRRVPFPPPELQRADESESDDPLAAAPARPESRGRAHTFHEDEPSRAGPSRVRRDSSASPSLRSQSRAGDKRSESRMSNHARRRLTLDEELRRAGDSLWLPSDEEEQGADTGEEEEEDMDSGTLVALGTRSSRRGFLARGGGAGPPVFMGEGYVQGAVAEDSPIVESSRRSRTNTGGSSRKGVTRR